jgi:hypothetical protein
MAQSEWNPVEKAWTIIVGLLILVQTVGLGIASWLLLAVMGVQQDVASMKANRYTIQDGYDAEKRTSAEILNLWKQIETVKADVRSLSERKP